MKLPSYLRRRGSYYKSKRINGRIGILSLQAICLRSCRWRKLAFSENSKILYLGSAEGNTISYLSEICKTNTITAVEISSVAMAELMPIAKQKKILFLVCLTLISLKNTESKQIILKSFTKISHKETKLIFFSEIVNISNQTWIFDAQNSVNCK